ncbi:MAG: CDP-glycerol glycerophosphotransferase family protein, partial [Candidatus Hadarchaeales archaeon]
MGSGNYPRKVQREGEKLKPYKVLFLPGNVYHVKMFSKVARKLKADVLAISLEGYGEKGRIGIERALRENGIRFKRVQDYQKENPEFILRQEKPDVMVVLNDVDPSCLPFVREANRLEIPTLLIAEGLYFGKLQPKRVAPAYFRTVLKNLLFSGNVRYSLKLQLRKFASILSGNPEPGVDKWGANCSKIAVWGEYSRKCFEMNGIPPERIRITGNPLMDELVEVKFNPEKIRKQLGIPKGSKLIVYASCNPIDINYWTEKESKEFVRLLNRIVLGLKNCFLLIRPHPTECEERYLRYLKGEDLGRTRVSKKENVYEILAAADILITDASVVGSEAAVMGKPVIVVNLTGKPYPTEQYPALLVREGVAVEVRRKDKLLPTIERLLNKESHDELVKNREKFVEKYFYKIDGQSSQ